MTAHLSSDDIAQYLQGASAPAELLRVDDHLAACEACRRRLDAAERVAAGVAAMRDVLKPDAGRVEHPAHDQIVAYVDAGLDAIDREIVESHLVTCRTCAEDVDDLRAVGPAKAGPHVRVATRSVATRSVATRSSVWYAAAGLAAAAAIVAAVLVRNGAGRRSTGVDTSVRAPQSGPPPASHAAPPVVVALADGGGTITLDAGGALNGIPGLEANDRDALVAALRSGQVAIPSDVVALAGRAGTLLGPSATASAFRPVTPVATAVDTRRPVFEWTALPAATTYVVSVFDERFDKIAASEPLSTRQWTPPQPLPPGRTYSWQIRAHTPAQDVVAPAPPAAEARFRVLGQAEADRVAALRRDRASSPLTLGVLLARAGLVDEAERRLADVVAANSASPLARQLLASVQDVRNRRP